MLCSVVPSFIMPYKFEEINSFSEKLIFSFGWPISPPQISGCFRVINGLKREGERKKI